MSRDEIGGRGDREPFVPRGGGMALAVCAVVLATAVGALRLAEQSAPGARPTRPRPQPRPAPPRPAPRRRTAPPPGWPSSACHPTERRRAARAAVSWSSRCGPGSPAPGSTPTAASSRSTTRTDPEAPTRSRPACSSSGSHSARSSGCGPTSPDRGPASARPRPVRRPVRPTLSSGSAVGSASSTSRRRPATPAAAPGVTEPETWLPPRAWQTRRLRAYVPSRFAVCYGLRGSGDTADVEDAPAVPDASLFGRTAAADRRLPADWPCSVVTTPRATRIVEALRGARVLRDSAVGSRILAYVIDVRSPVPGSPPREARLFFEPLLPDDSWPCTGCA